MFPLLLLHLLCEFTLGVVGGGAMGCQDLATLCLIWVFRLARSFIFLSCEIHEGNRYWFIESLESTWRPLSFTLLLSESFLSLNESWFIKWSGIACHGLIQFTLLCQGFAIEQLSRTVERLFSTTFFRLINLKIWILNGLRWILVLEISLLLSILFGVLLEDELLQLYCLLATGILLHWAHLWDRDVIQSNRPYICQKFIDFGFTNLVWWLCVLALQSISRHWASVAFKTGLLLDRGRPHSD